MFIVGMFFGFIIAVVVFVVSITYSKEIQTSLQKSSHIIRPPEKGALLESTQPQAEFLESLIHDDTV